MVTACLSNPSSQGRNQRDTHVERFFPFCSAEHAWSSPGRSELTQGCSSCFAVLSTPSLHLVDLQNHINALKLTKLSAVNSMIETDGTFCPIPQLIGISCHSLTSLLMVRAVFFLLLLQNRFHAVYALPGLQNEWCFQHFANFAT